MPFALSLNRNRQNEGTDKNVQKTTEHDSDTSESDCEFLGLATKHLEHKWMGFNPLKCYFR